MTSKQAMKPTGRRRRRFPHDVKPRQSISQCRPLRDARLALKLKVTREGFGRGQVDLGDEEQELGEDLEHAAKVHGAADCLIFNSATDSASKTAVFCASDGLAKSALFLLNTGDDGPTQVMEPPDGHARTRIELPLVRTECLGMPLARLQRPAGSRNNHCTV